MVMVLLFIFILEYNCLMAQLQLKVVTPEKQILDEMVDQVNVTTTEGELGILPHHASLMSKIVPGELKIKKGSKIEYFATGDGFMQIDNNILTVMTDMANAAEDIDEKAVEAAKKRAEEALSQKLSGEEYALTLANLEKALAQLRVKRRHRSR
jgi:F-type H+-transporting ATPase subunit epsilon